MRWVVGITVGVLFNTVFASLR